jgi:ribosomal protein S18 acetylase RimI-like enzyme
VIFSLYPRVIIFNAYKRLNIVLFIIFGGEHMTILIREARSEDASFLAWVMLAATRSHLPYGLWEHFVGGSEEECLSFLRMISLTNTPHLFHHDTFLIAQEDGQSVAGLSCYDPTSLGMLAFVKALPEVFDKMGWSKSLRKAALVRIQPYLSCTPDDVPDTWIIESVAVVPEARRRGIISMLLHECIARGKAKGFKRAQISVFIGNHPARNAYGKCGFKFEDEKHSAEFEAAYGDRGIARLLLEFN